MEDTLLPFNRIQHSLEKFTDVAIPHHLELLRQHRANIIKCEEAGDGPGAVRERSRAQRVCGQLRDLLGDAGRLRARLLPHHRDRFDAAAARTIRDTRRAVTHYLLSGTSAECAGSVSSGESVGVLDEEEVRPLPVRTQLLIDTQELRVVQREEALASWRRLHADAALLLDAVAELQRAAAVQAEQVESVASNVETAAVNVEVARRQLSLAEKLRVCGWGVAGACGGLVAAGPAGALLGGKAAAAAALAGTLAGYIGGSYLGSKRKQQIDHEQTAKTEDATTDADKGKAE